MMRSKENSGRGLENATELESTEKHVWMATDGCVEYVNEDVLHKLCKNTKNCHACRWCGCVIKQFIPNYHVNSRISASLKLPVI